MKQKIITVFFVASLAGCDSDRNMQYQKEKQYDIVSADGTITTIVKDPQSTEPWPGHDHKALFQMVKIGDNVVKVPTGYISQLDDENGKQSSLSLRTSIPGFPMHVEEGKTHEENRKRGINQLAYSRVFINVGFIDQDKDSRPQFGDVFNEAQLLERYFYSRNNNEPLGSPIELTELGLKRYTGKVLADREFVYTPIDDKIREPNGELIVITCDPVPSDLLSANALCYSGFILTKDVGVSYMFPPHFISHWKDIHKFVSSTIQIIK